MGTFSSSGPALTALSNDVAGAVEKVGRSVVAIHARPRVPTSGVVWRPGIVVATNHTVQREEEITVTLPDGRSVAASLLGRDAGTDLAVLKLQDGEAAAAETGDAASLRVGNLVLSVGRAQGDRLSASLGIVGSLGGSWRSWGGAQLDQFIRLDLSIYIGFSGSALVDSNGGVVGLNTTGLARGMALAVPAPTVTRVVEELVAKGHIARGYLGIGTQPVFVPERLRAKLGISSEMALMIVTVEPDGPADKAGIMIGDILLALDGSPARDITDIQAKLGAEYIGREVRVSVSRGGNPLHVSAKISERPLGHK